MRRKRFRRNNRTKVIIAIAAGALALAVGAFFLVRWLILSDSPPDDIAFQTGTPTAAAQTPGEQATPSPTPQPTLSLDLVPHAIEGETDPDTFGFETHVYVDDVEAAGYTRPDPIFFGAGEDYDTLEGVTTYRGTNYRDGASAWGLADIADEKLTVLTDIDKTTGAVGSWRGSGCTGQPVIVTWPDALRESMDALYDNFQHSDQYRDDFTEVIIASLDGNIYFMELSTGTKTRDPIKTGGPVKGTPSLDPRGWPIIYVGQGLNPTGSKTAANDMYFRAFSLIDGSMLHRWGYKSKDPATYRGGWQAYDASPLIDAASDTLIWPGENGVLYTVRLNTVYDTAANKVTMEPGPMVKYTYTSTRNRATGVYGIENSPVGWRNYLIFTDNAGLLQCLDINTMELIYANDLDNDSDVSMVLEEDTDEQTFYLYTGCEFDDNVVNATSTTGICYARKIDGLTGRIMWTTPFTVYTALGGDVDGGILASPILGREGTTMEGLIIYTVSSLIREDEPRTAMVVALDKEDGHIVWQVDMENGGWTPASPAAVYTQDGQGYIVQCLYKGTVKLIRVDGKSEDGARVVSSVNVGEAMGTTEPNNFEATPAVFGDMIVVGSKSGHFFFIKIS
jgi:hypothetical protein